MTMNGNDENDNLTEWRVINICLSISICCPSESREESLKVFTFLALVLSLTAVPNAFRQSIN